MGNFQKSSLLAVLLLALLLLPGAATAAPDYTVSVWSVDYQPGHPVQVNITGPVNMTISIKITDYRGDILAGRDAALDDTGNYSYSWSPSQDGDFNVTVQYSTGLIITKRVSIVSRVTPQQLGEVYISLRGMETRIMAALADLRGLVYIGMLLSVVAMTMSGVIFNYARKRVSRAETELEKLMREDLIDKFKATLPRKK